MDAIPESLCEPSLGGDGLLLCAFDQPLDFFLLALRYQVLRRPEYADEVLGHSEIFLQAAEIHSFHRHIGSLLPRALPIAFLPPGEFSLSL
jgi:hypothetical protein